MSLFEACAGCGHDIHRHFQDVTGKVQCVVVATGISRSGVSGIGWERHCDCADYYSEYAVAREAAKEADERQEKERMERFIKRALGGAPEGETK